MWILLNPIFLFNKNVPHFEDVINTCYSIFDNRLFIIRSSLFGIIKISVILVIFPFGFVFIERDIKKLVFIPLEKMAKKIIPSLEIPLLQFKRILRLLIKIIKNVM